jgi:tetratricopeptide (TPR) repeat protein
MPSLVVSCLGSVEWPLGLAAAAMGDIDAAVTHLERAVEANQRLGHRPMTMVAADDLAGVLATRGAPGDRARAVERLEQAAAIADEIGLAERASLWRQQALEVHQAGVGPDDAVLRRDSKRWSIDAGRYHAVAPDLVGVRYLGTLLTRPGEEVSAVDLCGGAMVEGAGHELIDRGALDSYRRRVHEIDEALVESADRRRAQRLRDEREALRAELSSVLALSGRSRRFVDSSERARTAVRKAIARAIDAIAAADGELGAELRATISTGRTCIYLPDPSRPRRWSVRA